jgi:hypothetical protein
MGLEHTAGTPPACVHLSNTPTECTPVPYVAPVTAVPPTGLCKRVKHNMYGAFGSLLLRSSCCPSQSGTLMPSPSPTETPHHHICAPNQCSHSWRWRSTVSTVPPHHHLNLDLVSASRESGDFHRTLSLLLHLWKLPAYYIIRYLLDDCMFLFVMFSLFHLSVLFFLGKMDLWGQSRGHV